MVMDPSNPNKLLVANMWQHRRTPWSFNSGGKGSGLYMTFDGGKTWKKQGKEDGIPDGDLGRIGLAFSQSQPSRVYAMIEATKNGLYKSDDGGFKWELVNSDPAYVTTRSFYFQDIRVDPQNENRIYSLYQPIAMSEDGGKTFVVIAPNKEFMPITMQCGSVQMILHLFLKAVMAVWLLVMIKERHGSLKNNFAFGQFYHINVDNEIPYHVMGGLQDNGSWWGPAYHMDKWTDTKFCWQDVGWRRWF